MTTEESQRMICGNTYLKDMCINTITKYMPNYKREDLVLLSLRALADLTNRAIIVGGMNNE